MHSADLPAVLLAGRSTVYKRTGMKKILRPARRRNEAFTQFFLEKIAGVQRAEPFGAVRVGRLSDEERRPRRTSSAVQERKGIGNQICLN